MNTADIPGAAGALIINVQDAIDNANRALQLAQWYAVGSLALLVFIALKVRDN